MPNIHELVANILGDDQPVSPAPRPMTKYKKLKAQYKGYILFFRATVASYYVYNSDARKLWDLARRHREFYYDLNPYPCRRANGVNREAYISNDAFVAVANMLMRRGMKIAVVDAKSLDKVVI